MLKRFLAIILTIAIFFGGLAHTQSVYAGETDTEESLQLTPENGGYPAIRNGCTGGK